MIEIRVQKIVKNVIFGPKSWAIRGSTSGLTSGSNEDFSWDDMVCYAAEHFSKMVIIFTFEFRLSQFLAAEKRILSSTISMEFA